MLEGMKDRYDLTLLPSQFLVVHLMLFISSANNFVIMITNSFICQASSVNQHLITLQQQLEEHLSV